LKSHAPFNLQHERTYLNKNCKTPSNHIPRLGIKIVKNMKKELKNQNEAAERT